MTKQDAALKRTTAADPASHRGMQALYAERFRAERFEEALPFARRAVALAPGDPDDRGNLAEILGRLDCRLEALAGFSRAIALDPQFAEAWQNRGVNYQALDLHEWAVICYDRVLALRPDHEDVAILRANAALALQGPGANQRVERALSGVPKSPKALMGRGCAFQTLGRFREAVSSHRRALALEPGSAEILFNLAISQTSSGLPSDAVISYRRALALRPTYAIARSNLIFLADFLPGLGFAEQQAERRKWADVQRRGIPAPAPHENTPDPARVIRLGYVSSDFRHHSAADIFGSILRHHDRSRFELFLYSGLAREDHHTRAFRSMASAWRSTVGMAPDALARQIRADRVDILIDLSGHSAGNHLLTFLRRPAPVQVTAWGFPNGTGLREIDYLFADPVLIPEEVRPLFPERIYDLPCWFTCEMSTELPAVTPLPAAKSGLITFGCFNRAAKITEEALEAWSRILALTPGSRLLLKDRLFDEEDMRRRVGRKLASFGITSERIDFRGLTPRTEHLAAIGDADIALDPFPHNGGVSTCEAVAMGVPVVALAGGSVSGRASASLLSAVGLTEWIASDVGAYIDIAVAWSARIEALSALKPTLRPRYFASPAGDAAAYTRAAEAAFRDIWRRWCEGGR